MPSTFANNLHSFELCLKVKDYSSISPVPRFLQFSNETFFVFCYSFFNFSPSGWTILALHTNDVMDNSVNFSFILARNLYLGFLEHFLEMPKIASHNKQPQNIIKHSRLIIFEPFAALLFICYFPDHSSFRVWALHFENFWQPVVRLVYSPLFSR